MTYRYPNLWRGCIGAWCPSVDRSRSVLLTDHSPYRNHGTLTNMDPPTDWVGSGTGVALDFDGTDDYAVSAALATVLRGLDTFSICFWAKKAATWSLNPAAIAVQNGATAADLLVIYPGDNSGGNGVRVFFNGSAIVNEDTATYDPTQWRHYALRMGGAGAVMYVDGISVGTSGTQVAITSNVTEFRIGNWNGSQSFQGQLDDIRIYSRTLAQTEIQRLATRRGIAYERQRTVVGYVAAAPASGGTSNGLARGVARGVARGIARGVAG